MIALGAPTTTLLDLDKGIWKAQELYRQIEDHMKELEEPSRAYNDNAFLRTFKFEDFDIIVPLGVLSSVKKTWTFRSFMDQMINQSSKKFIGNILVQSMHLVQHFLEQTQQSEHLSKKITQSVWLSHIVSLETYFQTLQRILTMKHTLQHIHQDQQLHLI